MGPSAVVRAAFEAWATLNHYLTFWPRLRIAAAAALALAALAGAGGLLAHRFGRRWALAIERRAGGPALVFGGTFLVMVASGGGHLYTPDEWTIYAAAAGLVNHGVPAAFSEEPYPLHHVSGPTRTNSATGQIERVYSKYGVVPTLLAAPLYAVARMTGPGPQLPEAAFPYGNRALPLVPLLLNPLLTAGTAALLYATARRLGYLRRAALAAAAAFSFGSLAWPYSKTLLNGTPAAFFLLLTLWALVRGRAVHDTRPLPWWSLGGAALGLAIATRYELALLAAPIAAWGLAARAPGATRQRTSACFLVALALVVGTLVLGMNWIKTGSPLDAGYGGEGGLSTLAAKPWYGLFGQLLSPGCGLVPHTPLMAVGLLGLIWLWEDAPGPALAAGGVVLLALAYYGSLSTWCGYTAWGPRYLVTIGPFLALPIASVWQRATSGGRNPFLWIVGGALFAWSASTNALGVLIDFNRGWQDTWANERTYLEATWLPFFTGVTTHTRLLREWLLDGRGGLDLYLWHQLGPVGPWLTGLLFLAGLSTWWAAWAGPASAPPAGYRGDATTR